MNILYFYLSTLLRKYFIGKDTQLVCRPERHWGSGYNIKSSKSIKQAYIELYSKYNNIDWNKSWLILNNKVNTSFDQKDLIKYYSYYSNCFLSSAISCSKNNLNETKFV